MPSISKYITCYKIYFLKALEFRAEIVGWITLNILPNVVLLFIWIAAYPAGSQNNGYTLPELLQYFMIGALINDFTSTHFEAWRSREIREGKIDYLMSKPMPYPTQIFIHDLAGKSFYIMLTAPVFLIVYFILTHFLPLPNFHLSLIQMTQFSFFLATTYLAEFFIALITVLLTFWFEGAEGLEHFKWIIITLFSGWMIPVQFMPFWLRNVVQALPLKYMYSVPIGIIQNKYSPVPIDFLYILLFLCFLYGTSFFVWRKAIYKYTSAGG
jgi:ABC-2 type transport system permease protein